jgi:hypothetical protein
MAQAVFSGARFAVFHLRLLTGRREYVDVLYMTAYVYYSVRDFKSKGKQIEVRIARIDSL